MKYIVGTKKEMSQIFQEDGTVIPVTLITCEPNVITQIRNMEKDGYFALQMGTHKTKKLNKPEKGHLKELGDFKNLNEIRITEEEAKNYKKGDKVDVTIFETGDMVKVTGTAKGKGFQGVVKRWGFHGSPASHGHKDQLRMPGSIGAATYPGRVLKGKKMGGRMGARKSTTIGLEVMNINKDKNQISVKGAIAGPILGKVLINQM